jgi:hypothetical protein
MIDSVCLPLNIIQEVSLDRVPFVFFVVLYQLYRIVIKPQFRIKTDIVATTVPRAVQNRSLVLFFFSFT